MKSPVVSMTVEENRISLNVQSKAKMSSHTNPSALYASSWPEQQEERRSSRCTTWSRAMSLPFFVDDVIICIENPKDCKSHIDLKMHLPRVYIMTSTYKNKL